MTAEIRRMRWRCRRGMLELDILFQCFMDQHYADLTPLQLAAFDRLLDMPDNTLWSLVVERNFDNDAGMGYVLDLLSGTSRRLFAVIAQPYE